MSQYTQNRTSALKRSPDIVFPLLVLVIRRAELALSTDALVADVINKMLITFVIFGNITSRLLSDICFTVLDKVNVFFTKNHLFCLSLNFFNIMLEIRLRFS